MRDFWLWLAVCGSLIVFAGVWCISKALFERWLNNDWCRHDWDMWSGVDKETQSQHRFCRKCNKGEKRYP